MQRVINAPTMIDLFAGCGGMSTGFSAAGFEPCLAVEWDLAAAATYAANHGGHAVYWGDIADVHDHMIPQVDVVVGGPPCQGFSNLGNKVRTDPRNKLWQEYLRVVAIARPKMFVLENVQRFRASGEFQMLLDQADHGVISQYRLSHGVLLAADYGVAQRRPRTIVIGTRVHDEPVPLPPPSHCRPGDVAMHAARGFGREPWRTVSDRIRGLPELPASTRLPDSRTTFKGRSVPGRFKGVDLHIGRQPRETSIARYEHVPPGGGRFDVPDRLLPRCWREKANGTTDVMGRMRWDAPSLTIRTEFFKPEKGQYLHPQHDERHQVNRVITHHEAALLQDFPEHYEWCGTKIEIAKQIGNAVPVGLARALGDHVMSYLG